MVVDEGYEVYAFTIPHTHSSGLAMDTLRVLVVDDEGPARKRLTALVEQTEGLSLVAACSDGREAMEQILRNDPDLVFLDVQMPEINGIEVVRLIGPDRMPPVVFVTAYDQYALKAFEVAALDYLLKPFDDERFEQALARARQLLELREAGDLHERLATLLRRDAPRTGEAADTPARSTETDYLERIAVDQRGQVRVVPVDTIDLITASGAYVELHVGEETYLIRERMQTREERLDPDRFARVHRSAIVRLDRIDAILYSAGGDYALRLKDGRRVKLSRGRREDLERRLGLDALG